METSKWAQYTTSMFIYCCCVTSSFTGIAPRNNANAKAKAFRVGRFLPREATSATTSTAASTTTTTVTVADPTLSSYLSPNAQIVKLSEFERGIEIVQDLGANETLLRVPFSKLATSDNGRQTPAGRHLYQARQRQAAEEGEEHHHEDTILDKDGTDNLTYCAIWLCAAIHEQKISNSNIYGNDTSLPSLLLPDMFPLHLLPPFGTGAFDHLPVFWLQSDLDELKGSPLLAAIRDKRQMWESLYQEICHADPEGLFAQQTSIDTFLYAKACAGTRTLALERWTGGLKPAQKKGVAIQAALVPMVDMLNHRPRSNPSTCDWGILEYEENGDNSTRMERGDFIVTAGPKGLQAGTEAFLSYGFQENSNYLLNYGFAVEDNTRYDGFSPDVAYLDVTGKSNNGRLPLNIGDPEIASQALSFFRVAVGNQDELVAMKYRTTNNNDSGISLESRTDTLHLCTDPLSRNNEQNTMMKLKDAIQVAIGNYPTSLNDDIIRLAEGKRASTDESMDDCKHQLLRPFTNARNAVLVRVGEKRVLEHWLQLTTACLLYLNDILDIEKGGEANDGSTFSGNTFEVYCSLLEAQLERVTPLPT